VLVCQEKCSYFSIFFGKHSFEVKILGFCKKAILFTAGGAAYVCVELLWRGRSHRSMFFAGGTCFLLLGKLDKSGWSAPARGAAGAGIITAVEYVTGLLANRQYQVWDYRQLPFNYQGQVCLPFYVLWIPLSLGAMSLYRRLSQLVRSL